jgi:YVTN family beta-propeller protein
MMIARALGVVACLTMAAFSGCTRDAHSQAVPAPLVLEKTVALPNVRGRIDHLAVDVRRRVVFVAELGAGSVEAVDVTNGRVLRRIGGLSEPQGLGYLPDRDELVVASADGMVRFYRAADFSLLGALKLGDDADDVRVDPSTGFVVVGYGDGALAVIDPATRKVTKTIALPAHPEGFAIDAVHHRAFVNLPGAGQIAVVDLAAGNVVSTFRAAHAANYPLMLDAASGEAVAVYRLPARLVVAASDDGKVRQDLKTCGDSDDLFLDAPRHRIYVSCGSGEIDVFGAGPGGYAAIGRIATSSGARTSLFVPELDRLFVAARAEGGRPAALLAFRPG